MNKNIWRDGMMGLVVGDALGCPVQFHSRIEIRNRIRGPVTGMETGGVYNMPEGTWTDDSSMAIATMASIIDEGSVNPTDIMEQFVRWEYDGKYTPFGKAFDQGSTCTKAILNYVRNHDTQTCGCTGERSNGNGALMRIMPVCLCYYDRQKEDNVSDEEAIEAIHLISGLTHNHLRSKICCGIYYFCVRSIIDGITGYLADMEKWEGMQGKSSAEQPSKPTLTELLQAGIDDGMKYYGRDIKNLTELSYIGRLFHLSEFREVPEEKIKASGYVIDTIEAVFWCLITTGSFKECLLKAVNT